MTIQQQNTNERMGTTSSTQKRLSGTGFRAESNVSIQAGCEHDCRYCCAKDAAIRSGRATSSSWPTPVLIPAALAGRHPVYKGTIMFPSSHDITPNNLDACVDVLQALAYVGNPLLLVTKPHICCVKRLCQELDAYKGQILFRFTIGSNNNRVLRFWEPGAPAFDERVRSLKWAMSHGFATSVSCEPMLDNTIDELISAVEPFVTDSIRLGRMRCLSQILAANCSGNSEARRCADKLNAVHDDAAMRALYERYKDHPKIRFENSIKNVVSLAPPVSRDRTSGTGTPSALHGHPLRAGKGRGIAANGAESSQKERLNANQTRKRIRDQARMCHGVADWKLKGIKKGLRYRVRMLDGRCGTFWVHANGKTELDIPPLPVGGDETFHPVVRDADLLQPAMLRDIVSRLADLHGTNTKPRELREEIWRPGQ